MVPGVLLVLTSLAGAGTPAPDASVDATHMVEVNGFATALTIAKTAALTCNSVRINLVMIEELRKRLHTVAADKLAFIEASRETGEALKKGFAEAPSRQAWCDAVFRLYGTDGKLIRDLLRRP